MINYEKKANYPLSFVATFTGCIDSLIEKLESQLAILSKSKINANVSSSKKIAATITKNAESIAHFRKHLSNWKKETLSQTQKLRIQILEQKLSKATRLNTKLFETVSVTM